MTRQEQHAPGSADALCVCACSMLFGTALIVGGGRFVGPRAALLAGHVHRLIVVESDFGMISRYAPIEPSDGKIQLTIVHEKIEHYTPPYGITSMFYDPFPRPEGGERISEHLNRRGRLIFISGVHEIERFPGRWEHEVQIDPMWTRHDKIDVYRKVSE